MPAKRTRRKSYKNMSVAELVKAREELQAQVNEIDDILGQAVEAVGAIKPTGAVRKYPPGPIPNSMSIPNYDPAFGPPEVNPSTYNQSFSTGLGAESAPKLNVNPNNPNVESAFTIFDADNWARQVAEASKASMDTQEYDIPQMELEIDNLKNQISDTLDNAKNPTGVDEHGQGSPDTFVE